MISEAEVQAKLLCQAELQGEGKACPLNPDGAQMKYFYFCHFGEAKVSRVMLLLNLDVCLKDVLFSHMHTILAHS